MTDLAQLAAWSAPREVRTKQGARILRTAPATESFWSAWRSQKEDLRAAGISCGKNRDGEWEACWWQPLAAETVQARTETREASRATEAEIDVPAPEGCEYMPFQRAGIAFAAVRAATLIADEMGLGKTIQAVGVINADPTIHSVVVVCPASLKLNWRREIERWSVRPVAVAIADGRHCEWPTYSTPTDAAQPLAPAHEGIGVGVVVVNYDVLHKHTETIAAASPDLVVIDEAHFAKNKKARRSKAVAAVVASARRKLLLTGTPIVNRPVELLPLLEMIGGDVIERTGGGFKFLRRYCNATQTRWGWDFSGSSNLGELQDVLRETCMVRRLKKDVLAELPPKRRQIITIAPNGAAGTVRAESDAMARHEDETERLAVAVELAKAGTREEYETAVAALTEHQRATFAEISRLRHETALAKVEHVISHVRDACTDNNGHKVVVMAHHHDVIEAIRAGLEDLGVVVLTGETAMADRQAAVDRFQADAATRVFVGSITAAGVGITLTAAAHVVFAELDWVPGNMSQAEDRCHRIGQTDHVLVQHLVLDESIDARLAKILVEKQQVLDAALDDERAEIAETPVVATRSTAATQTASQARIAREAEHIDEAGNQLIHRALQRLAAVCDGAIALDGHGFSGLDARIGRELAERPALSPRQAALGLRIVARYRRTQLSDMQAEIEALGSLVKNGSR